MARHVYMDFPSSYTRTLAVFVVFTSVVEFIITAVYMGGVPVAEHDSLYPWTSRTTGAGITTLGEADKTNK